MEEDDDDFYAPGDVQVKSEGAAVKTENAPNGDRIRDETMEEADGSDEEEDEDDEDSDVDIITELKDGAAPEPPPQVRPFQRIKIEHPRTASSEAVPTRQSQQPTPSVKPSSDPSKRTTISVPDSSKLPAIHSSTIDLDGTPTWTPTGKPINEIDIDADIADERKIWRQPGVDQTDFFNYGFDEFTWVHYCSKQAAMRADIASNKEQMRAMESFLGPVPGSNPAAPNPDEMMGQAMMAIMQQHGITDPTQVPFDLVMQQMQQLGGMPGMMPGMPSMPPSGPSGYGGQGQGQQQPNQGYGGQQMAPQASNQGGQNPYAQQQQQQQQQQQHSQSPYPGQQGQQGYGGGGGTPNPGQQAQQGGPGGGPNYEGYNAQQIAIMQGGQGGGGGGGGGGGRGRGRGRRW